MNQLLTHEGDAHSTPAGRYSVNVINNGTACGQHLYRVTVTHPGFTPQPAFDRDHDRPFGHTDQAQAQQLAEHYAAGLVELFTVEAEGITDERIAEVAQGVNAAMVERTPVDVSDEIDNPADSWDAFRRNTRRDFTKTRVSSQPRTPAQLDRIRQHQAGIVTRAPGQPWVLLKGLVDRGLGQPHEVAGRHAIVSVRLNHRGLQLAELKESAA